ncbi:hypothetical protein J2X66_005875 [Pseudomonas sp. 3296]|uniref:hypothetical protein n=1 Tax=Pseudomonas sp. 3296 TaxID=2817753 RepID=UPI0028621D14|nr:hypothetical protein [Pseudomonas sp. 3296]MDR6918970.1 hypothetical protein [Pseudomonas sp. 3296]
MGLFFLLLQFLALFFGVEGRSANRSGGDDVRSYGNILYVVLMSLSFSTWADCPEAIPSLMDNLSRPMLKGNEIIAVVKGTLGTEGDEGGFLVSTVEVTQSYGLAIPKGKYLISYTSHWGNGCIFDEDRPRRPDESEIEKGLQVYFAVSRFYGRTLVTPEYESHGLFLVENEIQYEDSEGTKRHIEQVLFERNILTGVPKKLWLIEHP